MLRVYRSMCLDLCSRLYTEATGWMTELPDSFTGNKALVREYIEPQQEKKMMHLYRNMCPRVVLYLTQKRTFKR